MGVKIQLFEVGACRSDFCLWGSKKSEVYKEKVRGTYRKSWATIFCKVTCFIIDKPNTRDELVARIMSSAALIKQERQVDLRRATHTLAKRVEKCIEVDGGIFEHLFWIVAIY